MVQKISKVVVYLAHFPGDIHVEIDIRELSIWLRIGEVRSYLLSSQDMSVNLNCGGFYKHKGWQSNDLCKQEVNPVLVQTSSV